MDITEANAYVNQTAELLVYTYTCLYWTRNNFPHIAVPGIVLASPPGLDLMLF